MKNLNGLYYKIASDVPGASEAVMFNALYEATRLLCREALCWQQTLNAVDITASQADYIIEPDIEEDEDPQIVRVVGVTAGGMTLDPWDYCMADFETLRLTEDPTADIVDGLVVTLALEPANGIGYVPNDLYNRHENTIANGALWQLMKQPKKPWSDPVAAVAYRREFNEGIAQARLEMLRGVGTTNELRVEMRSL